MAGQQKPLQSGAPEVEQPIDSREAARYLGIHPKTVSELAGHGKLPCHRLNGNGRYFFFKSELFDRLKKAPAGVDSSDCSCRPA